MRRLFIGLGLLALMTAGVQAASLDSIGTLPDWYSPDYNGTDTGYGYENCTYSCSRGLSSDGLTTVGYVNGDVIWNGTPYKTNTHIQVSWTKTGGLVAENTPGWAVGDATGIGANGYMSGKVQDIARFLSPGATVWSAFLPSSEGVIATYNSMSGNGLYAVGDREDSKTNGNRAYRWASPYTANGTQVAGVTSGEHKFTGVSNGGDCVGQDGSGGTYWPGSGAAQRVPALGGETNTGGQAWGISDNGLYVTGYLNSPNTGPGSYKGFIWSPGDANATPRNPLGSDTLSGVFEASDGGACAGWSYGAEGSNASYDAVIWDAAGTPQELLAVLASIGVDTSEWSYLLKAFSMSPDGLTISGAGYAWVDPNDHGQGTILRGFVAVLPEPATLSFLALGGLMLLRRKR